MEPRQLRILATGRSNAMWYSVVTNAENLPRNEFRDLVVQKAREGFLAYYPSFK